MTAQICLQIVCGSQHAFGWPRIKELREQFRKVLTIADEASKSHISERILHFRNAIFYLDTSGIFYDRHLTTIGNLILQIKFLYVFQWPKVWSAFWLLKALPTVTFEHRSSARFNFSGCLRSWELIPLLSFLFINVPVQNIFEPVFYIAYLLFFLSVFICLNRKEPSTAPILWSQGNSIATLIGPFYALQSYGLALLMYDVLESCPSSIRSLVHSALRICNYLLKIEHRRQTRMSLRQSTLELSHIR